MYRNGQCDERWRNRSFEAASQVTGRGVVSLAVDGLERIRIDLVPIIPNEESE